MADADIVRAVAVCAELTGTTLSKSAAAIFVEDLEGYPKPAVLAALERCRRELRGRITVADVIQRIKAADGRPGVEESWALMPKAEAESAVITQEMAAAWGAAWSLICNGDAIAARMAFKEVYERECVRARDAGLPVRWFLSAGHDQAGREAAVRRALDLGRLTQACAVALIPQLADVPVDPEGRERIAEVRAKLLEKLSVDEGVEA